MKKLLILFFSLFLCFSLSAERISGRVSDRDGHAIAYATISLLSSDSTLLTGAITDDGGNYNILDVRTGSYILSASFVGFAPAFKSVSVPVSSEIDLVLLEETEQLAEVEVKAKRPLIERQMDKLVLNVSQSAFAVGNNGQDILRKAPGVNIDKDGNVTVNGKSVEVWIDGRPSYLSGDQLKALLMGTDGATIEKIEIITNPSAKYDAAGQGGIINIKLRRNMMKGLNGMLNASYGGMYFAEPKHYCQNDNVSFNLNYRSSNTYTAFSLMQMYADVMTNMYLTSSQPITSPSDTTQMTSQSLSQYQTQVQYYMAKLSNDWYIDAKNTLGFIVQAPIMLLRLDGDTLSSFSETYWGDSLLRSNRTQLTHEMFSPQLTANINFTHTFEEQLSRELTVNVDYNRYLSGSKNRQYNYPVIGAVPPDLRVRTDQVIDIASAKLDFQTLFWKTGMLEAGGKYAFSSTDNQMITDTLSPVISATRSDFLYREHVAALYISLAKQFGQKVSAKVGLRGEYTNSHGEWITADTATKASYFNLFPTAFVSYTPSQNWPMSISYTRRIKRPSYYQLNPFVTYYDAHNYQMGNPNLKPEFNHQVDLNFAWSQYISLALNFSHTEAMLNQKVQIQPNDDQVSTWVNFGTCTTHGGSLSFTEIPLVPKRDAEGKIAGAWLTMTVNGSYFNFINRATDDESYVEKSNWGRIYGTLTAYLPEDIQMSVDGYWSSPITNGYTRWLANYGMNFAFKKAFLQKRLNVSLQVRDLLRSSVFDQETLGLPQGAYSKSRFCTTAQSINIGISYMFGQQQMHKWRKVGNTDESSRLGSGGIGASSRQ